MNDHAARSVDIALSPFGLVLDVVAYIDTVSVVFFPKLPRDERERLKALNAGRLRLEKRRNRKGRFIKPGQVWVLHQPTVEALMYLAELRRALPTVDLSGPYDICRVDIAYDFLCHTPHDAEIVHDCLRQYVRQKWHGRHQAISFQNSHYARPAGTPRNIARYADKPSKVTGEPCAHLELRFSTVRKCRDYGFDDPLRLAQGISAGQLLDRETSIDVPIQQRFERYLERFAQRAMRKQTRFAGHDLEQLTTGISRVIAAALQNELTFPQAGSVTGVRTQDAHDLLPRFRRTMVGVDWEDIIDPPRWIDHRL